jgi:hypothetical protein
MRSALRIFRDQSLRYPAAAARPEDHQRHADLRRVANILNTDAMLFQEFCDRFSKHGDKTLPLFADGQAVEIPVF